MSVSAVGDELVENGGFELPVVGGDETDPSPRWATYFGINGEIDEEYCANSVLIPGSAANCIDGTTVPGWFVVWQRDLDGVEYSEDNGNIPADGIPAGRLEIQRGMIGEIDASEGVQKAELDTHHRVDADGFEDSSLDNNVGIIQLINTCERQPYTLTFDYKPRTDDAFDNSMRVLIDDVEISTITEVADEWSSETYNYIGSDNPLSAVGFTSFGTATTLGMFLDNVSIQGLDGGDGGANCVPPPAVCGDKPAVLTMLYNGPFSTGDFYTQDPEEVIIESFLEQIEDEDGNLVDAPLPAFVEVRVFDHHYGKNNGAKAELLLSEIVNLGQTFSFSGTKGKKKLIPPQTTIELWDVPIALGDEEPPPAELLQRVTFHSSCSQPLNVGDQFGGVAVWGFSMEPPSLSVVRDPKNKLKD